ncbi:MAG: lysylphosphatidylglycerol synthase transmembrane domain-containing protein [Parvularculaceae bacterium]|nr:flippase-like domain-containing protein [Parvularculaceae bacterium]
MSAQSETAATSKGWTTRLFRIGLSVAILFVLFRFVNAGDLLARISKISPLVWIGVFAGFLLGHSAAAAKWRLLIGGDTPYLRALQAHFAGLAANIALPGVAGGDVVRAGLVMKGSDRKTALALGSLADRLIDTCVLLVIAALGAALLGARAGVDPNGLMLAGAGVATAGVATVFSLRPIAMLLRSKAPGGKIGAIVRDIAQALDEIAGRKGALCICIALSLAIQLSFAAMNGLIAHDIGAGTPLAVWIFAWPLAKLIATLPISFGGLGVREVSIAGLTAPMGYDASSVIAASLIWQSVLYAGGIAGAIAQAFGLRELKRGAEANHG